MPWNTIELESAPVPQRALAALGQDTNLPVCTACGMQYPAPRENCPVCDDPREKGTYIPGPICDDPRQNVPDSGQSWSSLGDLTNEHHNVLLQDKEDPRVTFIKTEPGFAISQTPMLLKAASGHYLWDCCALLSPPLAAYLTNLQPPLKAIAISHPHFYTSSLTWARALGVPLYLNELDAGWHARVKDFKPDDNVHLWRGSEELGPGVTLTECGGHFPGSSILVWDRAAEPEEGRPESKDANKPLALVADTFMVQPTQRAFTFLWSYPNGIPLHPKDVLGIRDAVKDIDFWQASSTWPGRFLRYDAKRIFNESVEQYLHATGWSEGESGLVPSDELVGRSSRIQPE